MAITEVMIMIINKISSEKNLEFKFEFKSDCQSNLNLSYLVYKDNDTYYEIAIKTHIYGTVENPAIFYRITITETYIKEFSKVIYINTFMSKNNAIDDYRKQFANIKRMIKNE